MAQAVDGNWYGYFADRKQCTSLPMQQHHFQLMLQVQLRPVHGLDFGILSVQQQTAGPGAVGEVRSNNNFSFRNSLVLQFQDTGGTATGETTGALKLLTPLVTFQSCIQGAGMHSNYTERS